MRLIDKLYPNNGMHIRVIYKRAGDSTGFAMLAKLNSQESAFIALDNNTTSPAFKAQSKRECIRKVLKAGREVYAFETMEEMCEFIYHHNCK